MATTEVGHNRGGGRNPTQTTERLLKAAADAFVQHGYDKARVSEIARNAEVTVGAIYARWPDKTAVMVAALDHIFEQVLPQQRIERLGLLDLPLPELVKLWAAELLEPSSPREIFVQVFGSARNNVEVRERLGKFLDDQFDQISRLVERGKVEGHADPEIGTAALALFMRALGIGVHMVMTSQLDEKNVPGAEEWVALIERFILAARPPST